MSFSGIAASVDFTVRRQCRVLWSTFSAEFDGLVGITEHLLLLQVALHQLYCGTTQTLEDMVYLLENVGLHPKLDIGVDACGACDAILAIEVCEPPASSFKPHLVSVRDQLIRGIIRRIHWVDARDMLAGGLTIGGVHRTLLRNVSNACSFKLAHEALTRNKQQVGFTTGCLADAPAEKPE